MRGKEPINEVQPFRVKLILKLRNDFLNFDLPYQFFGEHIFNQVWTLVRED
jgi:hypothetical protein